MGRLDGRIVLVTGAASGIGLAIASACVAEHAHVLMIDRNEAALHQVTERLGPSATMFVADVSVPDSASNYVRNVLARFGRIDAAILNAAIAGPAAPLETIATEDFDRVFAVNVRGVWFGLQALFPPMKAQKSGNIVIMSSVGGYRGAPRMAPYVASKHAVIGLMRTAAIEGASSGIRVNAIAPAPVDTAMMAGIAAQLNSRDPQAALRRSVEHLPLRRMATPAEIAAMAVFLLSDESSYCTGTVFPVDGGLSAGI